MTHVQFITTRSHLFVTVTATDGAIFEFEKPTSAPISRQSPWVWAIIGAVIALVLFGLGIVGFLYKRGKVESIKKRLNLRPARELVYGDLNWGTGDIADLQGESSTLTISTGLPKEMDATATAEPKELDSNVIPVEMPTTNDPFTRSVELPTGFNDVRPTPHMLDIEEGRKTRASVVCVGGY